MSFFKIGEHVRIKRYPKDGINGYGVVKDVTASGRYWVANMNMPYSGTVSAFFSSSELGKVSYHD